MEAAFEFAVNREIMEFASSLVRDGRTIPAALFIDILTKKCQLLNKHLCSTRDCLMILITQPQSNFMSFTTRTWKCIM